MAEKAPVTVFRTSRHRGVEYPPPAVVGACDGPLPDVKLTINGVQVGKVARTRHEGAVLIGAIELDKCGRDILMHRACEHSAFGRYVRDIVMVPRSPSVLPFRFTDDSPPATQPTP